MTDPLPFGLMLCNKFGQTVDPTTGRDTYAEGELFIGESRFSTFDTARLNAQWLISKYPWASAEIYNQNQLLERLLPDEQSIQLPVLGNVQPRLSLSLLRWGFARWRILEQPSLDAQRLYIWSNGFRFALTVNPVGGMQIEPTEPTDPLRCQHLLAALKRFEHRLFAYRWLISCALRF